MASEGAEKLYMITFDALATLRQPSTNLEDEGERLRFPYFEGEKEPMPCEGFEWQELWGGKRDITGVDAHLAILFKIYYITLIFNSSVP